MIVKKQKSRDAKSRVLTPRSRNVVLQSIKKASKKKVRQDRRYWDSHYA
jgi:hypothetical protein|tara:strand:- start:349 stop:495 length:147 start_codon:yes stop_codon:yes gene_type:complete